MRSTGTNCFIRSKGDTNPVSYTHLDVYKRQVLFVLFSLGGAVFGMGEEALPFTMILCPLFVAVGYDSVIAVLVTYVATQIGFGSSWMLSLIHI